MRPLVVTIEIRDLKSKDKAAWYQLWQQYLTFYESQVPEEVTELTFKRMMTEGEEPHGLGAFDEAGVLVGIVHYLFHRSSWTVGDYCYLQDLYVCPGNRSAGIGEALLFAVYDKADKRGASQVYWLTQESNERARRLYDRVGELTSFVKYKGR